MHGPPTSRDNRQSDPQKSDTPDKHRNDKAQRKAPDQPDHTGGRERRDPEKDYPDARDTGESR